MRNPSLTFEFDRGLHVKKLFFHFIRQEADSLFELIHFFLKGLNQTCWGGISRFGCALNLLQKIRLTRLEILVVETDVRWAGPIVSGYERSFRPYLSKPIKIELPNKAREFWVLKIFWQNLLCKDDGERELSCYETDMDIDRYEPLSLTVENFSISFTMKLSPAEDHDKIDWSQEFTMWNVSGGTASSESSTVHLVIPRTFHFGLTR